MVELHAAITQGTRHRSNKSVYTVSWGYTFNAN